MILPAISVPNVITPDNDGDDSGMYSSGLNDGWFILGIEHVDNLSVAIFDRWGGMVYEDNSYSNSKPFRGYSMNGDLLSAGVYFYVLETSRGEQLTGSLTILRAE